MGKDGYKFSDGALRDLAKLAAIIAALALLAALAACTGLLAAALVFPT